MSKETVIATLEASGIRRIFAYITVFGLGAFLIVLAFFQPPSFGWQLFLIAFGAAMLVVAERLRRATLVGLVLTQTELRDTTGAVLTPLENIKKVDRGLLALKPSNGFVLRLHQSNGGGWAPGVWWRFGKSIGVGGTTSSGQAKFMAEQIALHTNDV